jgi:molybdenum cofactor cytidylyltransferase
VKRGIVVLAAGLSRRMAGPNKLLQVYKGLPLAAWAFACAAQTCAEVGVVVLGRDAGTIRALAPSTFAAIIHPSPDDGLASSLRLGLTALGPVDAAAILLADMPDIQPALVNALFNQLGNAFAAVPRHGEAWGNPVVLSAAAIAEVSTLSGDSGARQLLIARADELAFVDTNDPAIFHDLDTAEDFTT